MNHEIPQRKEKRSSVCFESIPLSSDLAKTLQAFPVHTPGELHHLLITTTFDALSEYQALLPDAREEAIRTLHEEHALRWNAETADPLHTEMYRPLSIPFTPEQDREVRDFANSMKIRVDILLEALLYERLILREPTNE